METATLEAETAAQTSSLAAAGPMIPATLEDLAAEIKPHLEAVIGSTEQAIGSGLAVGALVVEFSERPEILAEVERANTGRRGRKFTPYGFVARLLSEPVGR